MDSSKASVQEESHDKNRLKVCVVCYRKGKRLLSYKEVENVRSYIIDDYDINNSYFPAGICDGCHLLLNKKANGHDGIKFPEIDYEGMILPRLMRSSSTSSCSCQICTVAIYKAKAACKLKKKRGRPASSVSHSVVEETTIKVCAHCFAKVHRGNPHSKTDCASRRQKVYNLENLIDSPVTEQRIASRVIKLNEGTPLDTLGPSKMTIVSESGNLQSKTLFSAANISDIQKNLSKHLAEDLRLASGSRKVIEPNLIDNLYKINHELDHYFEVKSVRFCTELKGKPTKYYKEHAAICKDLPGLIEKVIQTRNLDESRSLIRIGIDGGGGFLKICLSIFDLDIPSFSGKTLSKKFKDSGVKKVLILAVTPDVQENYVNLKHLWIDTGIISLERPFTIATDLKLCNILLGLMSHSSLHPCCWCNIDKRNLSKKGTQRTIGNLSDIFWKYYDARGTKKNAKNFGNAIHPSMVTADKETPILLIVPPPELHLLIGPVNTLYDALNKEWPESERWLKICNVKKTEYHGGSFVGNESRKLLKRCKDLNELCPSELQSYVQTFKAFDEVVDACYSRELKSNYKDKIGEFKKNYLNLGINVTPKVHAVMYRVEEFCEIKGMGLSPTVRQLHALPPPMYNVYGRGYKHTS